MSYNMSRTFCPRMRMEEISCRIAGNVEINSSRIRSFESMREIMNFHIIIAVLLLFVLQL